MRQWRGHLRHRPGLPLLQARRLAEGTILTLGIRPEAITISSDPERSLPATVDLVSELGGSRVAYCTVKGLELAVVLPATDEPYEADRYFWISAASLAPV